jgi:D-alanyl-D-alanine carboxypeptidase
MEWKMKNSFMFLILFIFGIYSCNSNQVSEVVLDYSAKFEKIQKLIDSTWNEYSTKNNIADSCGIACYVTINGNNHFFKTFPNSNINENFRYRVASNTKVFTAAAIMLLHQNGRLNINDTISQKIPNSQETYLPNTPDFNIPFKDRITIKQLLQHRAGVFDIANSLIPDSVNQPYAGTSYYAYKIQSNGIYYQFSIDELIKVLSDCQIFYCEPGQEFYYSNTGYQVLAKIIERVSGKTYVDYINSEIIVKLGLSYTSIPWLGTDIYIPEHYIPGFVITSGGVYNSTGSNMSFNIAEGNIISSFSDMNKWIRLLFTGKAGISNENIQRMKDYSENPVKKFGLGIEYLEGIGFGHTGAHSGYSSKTVYNDELNLCISFLSNFWNYRNDMSSLLEQYNYTQDLVKGIVEIMKK